MPGCYFQVAGTNFNPDAFLASTTLKAYRTWHVGEQLAEVGPRSSRTHQSSGFRCNVSDADGNLDGQVDDAMTFLSAHKADLERLAIDTAVEDRRLDFGFESRLGVDNVAVQGEFLPVDFLRLVGGLSIGVAFSIYPPTVEKS